MYSSAEDDIPPANISAEIENIHRVIKNGSTEEKLELTGELLTQSVLIRSGVSKGNNFNSSLRYANNWGKASLKKTLNNFVSNSIAQSNAKGTKSIYTNNKTGTRVIYDKKGDYFRIQDKEGHYLDLNGNRVNVPSNLSGKEASNYVKKNTHFKNSD